MHKPLWILKAGGGFHMKYWIAVVIVFVMPACAAAQQRSQVLMIVNEAKSEDLELMLTKEVGVMKDLLRKAGFEVAVSSGSSLPLTVGTTMLKPDLKFSDAVVTDYKGIIIPCMATSASPLTPEGYAIIRQAVEKGIPIAAQTGSVVLLSQAGVLKGKRYALAKGWPNLDGAVYGGEGIVQDGKIITSGICPMMAKNTGRPDGTSRLIETLIHELNK
jgi:putative intracellular protease/amidase